MKAVRLVAPRRFDLIELPDPMPGAGEVVVRVDAVSVCGSDLAAFRGEHPRIAAPVVLGHEFSGTIEAVGTEVPDSWVGARGTVEPTIACGVCRWCRQGRENICPSYGVIGESVNRPGAFATHVLVRADHFNHIPDSMTSEVAAILQPAAVAVHAVRDRAQVRLGERVLVVGAGGIGSMVQLVCQASGAATIVVDKLASRVARARELGAELAVLSSSPKLDAVIQDATDGDGVDVAFEAAGGTVHDPVVLAVDTVAPGGRVVILGSFSTKLLGIPMGIIKSREIDVRGSQAHPNSFPAAIEAISSGLMKVESLITDRARLGDAEEWFERLADADSGILKLVFPASP